MLAKFFEKIFGGDKEYSKRWLSRVTVAVMAVFLFVIPLIILLLVLNLKMGLSYKMTKVIFDGYIQLLKVTVSGYFVAFIGYMGKAFLAKREEEKNKLKQKQEDEK